MSWKSYLRFFEMHPLHYLVLCLLPVFAHSLELAVGTTRGPTILKPNGEDYIAERIGGYRMHNLNIPAIAVDVTHGRVFFAYSDFNNGTLLNSLSLKPEEDEPTFHPIIREGQGVQRIRSMVYDEVNDALYWTDSRQREISMISLPNQGQNVTVLRRFGPKIDLAGIAVDACHGLLFWSNDNHRSPSVERLFLNDTSRSEVIISSNLFMPMALAVDSSGDGRLFWTDDMAGSEYKIEMSRLDGSGRVALFGGHYQRPFSLSFVPSVGLNTQEGVILWLDRNSNVIWELEISIDGRIPDKNPRRMYYFEHDTALGMVAMSSFDVQSGNTCGNSSGAVVTEANLTLTMEDDHLSEILEVEESTKEDRPRSLLQETVTQVEDKETTSGGVERMEKTTISSLDSSTAATRAPENDSVGPNLVRHRLCDDYCINGELVDEGHNVGGPVACKCFPGYSGSRCEKSLCDNFCFHGSCKVEEVTDGNWQPKCRCRSGFAGRRCERDPCAGYCLNNGRCRVGVDGQPKCTCLGNGKWAKGKRCELCPNLLEEVCRLLCSVDSSKTSVSVVQLEEKDGENAGAEGPLCVCPPGSNNDVYSTAKGGLNVTAVGSETTTSLSSYPIMSPIFLIPVAICLVLLVIALFLAYKVMKLKRLPRIKKRIIVSKGSVPLAAGCGGPRGRGSPSGGTSPIVEEQQQCEITIENCCNMNVCETPCFEPQLRSPGKSSSSKKGSTKEEKKVLLGNMEAPKSSCGPCPGVDELY